MVAGLLRDSVVLCDALGRIGNGHPASVVVENQRFTNLEISNFSIPSSFEPGGRRFESVRARFSIPVKSKDKDDILAYLPIQEESKPRARKRITQRRSIWLTILTLVG